MAIEVKVYHRKKKDGKPQQIDHIPKCFQLPRSASTSKPRTEFFLPICSSKDIELEQEIQSSVTMGSSDISNDTTKRIVYSSSTKSTKPESRKQENLTNGKELAVADVESIGQQVLVQPCSNRSNEDKDDVLELTPNRSQLTENSESCVTPGSVVWAKTNGKCWWPAEILEQNSHQVLSSTVSSEGHVLVRYFGKHKSAWVDPATNVSSFDELFKERSCDQAKEFQNALKQALQYKEHPKSCKESSGSPDESHHVNQRDRVPERDNSSSSSRAGTECTGRARSKRERKRKVHFDEVTCPFYTSRKVRRFKIMRSLGLAAPVGSPFNFS